VTVTVTALSYVLCLCDDLSQGVGLILLFFLFVADKSGSKLISPYNLVIANKVFVFTLISKAGI